MEKRYTLGRIVGRLQDTTSRIMPHVPNELLRTAETWTLFVDVVGVERLGFPVDDQQYAAAAIGQEVIVVVEESGPDNVVPIELLFELPAELQAYH